MTITRREALALALGLGALPLGSATDGSAADAVAGAGTPAAAGRDPTCRHDFEGRRRADLGNGRHLNPVLAGDRPDPTILKDGGDYYATFSSFDATPGLVLWHSRDLINWAPIGPALAEPPGAVVAAPAGYLEHPRHPRRGHPRAVE